MPDRRVANQREERARVIAEAGGLVPALESGRLPRHCELTAAEAIVLGLLRQEVRDFLCAFDGGGGELADVLHAYDEAGLIRVRYVRSQAEAAHAATALRWVRGQKAAVVASMGPGALQALGASLPARNGNIGVWHIFTEQSDSSGNPDVLNDISFDPEKFRALCANLGGANFLDTAQSVGDVLRQGLKTVDNPHQASPFFLLLPADAQAQPISDFDLDALPVAAPAGPETEPDEEACERALHALRVAQRVVVKIGAGASMSRDGSGEEIVRFLKVSDSVAVTSPLASGVIPFDHPRNMTVGGRTGSTSGNYAMQNADCLVCVATPPMSQSECDRAGYPGVKKVIHIGAGPRASAPDKNTIDLPGGATATLRRLNEELSAESSAIPSEWFADCCAQRAQWEAFKTERYDHAYLYDPVWKAEVLTQPAAIKTATDWARANDAVVFIDAGDVQTEALLIAEDDRAGQTYAETAAGQMGFAPSALLATALASKPFYGLAICGDGSFVMNPQILIDGLAHGARGCVLLLDNRRLGVGAALPPAERAEKMAADPIPIDYLAWARAIRGVKAIDGGRTLESLSAALEKAHAHKGLCLVHVPVYFGPDPLGSIRAFDAAPTQS